MKVLAGLGLGGPTVAMAANASTRASLGRPAWGQAGLLRDLELRIGSSPITESASARIPRWTARIKSLAASNAFYNRSFSVDELGTAVTLLEWRDALVEAGWDGAPIAGGGERLNALAALEGHEREGAEPGHADRLVRVERAIANHERLGVATADDDVRCGRCSTLREERCGELGEIARRVTAQEKERPITPRHQSPTLKTVTLQVITRGSPLPRPPE